MLKELVTPHAANVFVGKLGDILEKARQATRICIKLGTVVVFVASTH